MSFGDEVDLPYELPDLNRERTIEIELTGADATLLRLLGERLGLQPASVVRIALVAFAAEGRRW